MRARPWAFRIGVGKAGFAGLPSLRTVRADFPHTALQLAVHLREDCKACSWATFRLNNPRSAKYSFGHL
jgi:hypothetical protein